MTILAVFLRENQPLKENFKKSALTQFMHSLIYMFMSSFVNIGEGEVTEERFHQTFFPDLPFTCQV